MTFLFSDQECEQDRQMVGAVLLVRQPAAIDEFVKPVVIEDGRPTELINESGTYKHLIENIPKGIVEIC
jgi:hypothetical protein